MVQPLFNVDALPIVAGELSLGAGRQLDRFHLEGDFRSFFQLINLIIIFFESFSWWEISKSPVIDPRQCDICHPEHQKSQHCEHL